MYDNIFEAASRLKLRYPHKTGLINTEDLWDLNLQSLNSVAKECNKLVKTYEEEDFILENKTNDSQLKKETLRLDVVKYVIKVKLQEKSDREQAATKAATKTKILEAIERKQDEELGSKSIEELKKELAAL